MRYLVDLCRKLPLLFYLNMHRFFFGKGLYTVLKLEEPHNQRMKVKWIHPGRLSIDFLPLVFGYVNKYPLVSLPL